MQSTIQQLSFRDVLHSRGERLGHIDRMRDLARTLGYPYFLWNDRVYATDRADYVDTGLTVSNVL